MITSRLRMLVVLAAGAAMVAAGVAMVRHDAADPSDAGRPPTEPVSTELGTSTTPRSTDPAAHGDARSTAPAAPDPNSPASAVGASPAVPGDAPVPAEALTTATRVGDLFGSSCVSRITIDAPASSLEALGSDPKGDYQPATMRFDVCGRPTPEYASLEIGLRLKGSASFRPLGDKAAFKIKMPKGQRVGGLKRLTLNNMVQDPSKMSEFLAYEAFRAVGIAAPRVGYATVSLNGDGYGLYANVETPDDVMLDRVFGEDTTEHLYEVASWQDHPDPAARDVNPASILRWEVDEGDEDDRRDLEAVAAIAEIESDDLWWDAFQAHFHVRDVLRMWAVETYTGHWDGYAHFVNNFFLHNHRIEGIRLLPWGADQAFVRPLGWFDQHVGQLTLRCMGHEPCRSRYQTELDDVRRTLAEADLVTRATVMYHLTAAHVADDPHHTTTSLDHCAAVNRTIDHLSMRVAQLANETGAGHDGVAASRLPCHLTQGAAQ